MEKALYAILGWLFGLASAIMLEINRNQRTVHSLRRALHFELQEISNRLADVVWLLSVRIGDVSKELQDWLLRTQERYSGISRDEKMIEAMRKDVQNPDQISEYSKTLRAQTPTKSPALKKYPTPALDAAVSKINDFPATEQVTLLEIRTLFTVYEAIVDDSREFFRMTFDDSITGLNRSAVIENLRTTYQQAITVCRQIVDHVAKL